MCHRQQLRNLSVVGGGTNPRPNPLTKHLHCTAIAVLAESHNIHVFALTETGLILYSTSAETLYAIPHCSPLFRYLIWVETSDSLTHLFCFQSA
jgi:hypothetical protein